jgi:hypothetical protein
LIKLDPTATRVVVGDIHGDIRGLRSLLERIGAIDAAGTRQPGFYLVQLGDLLHCGHGEFVRDRATAEFCKDLFDVQLAGNHELWHAYGLEVGRFAGLDKKLFPETQEIINYWVKQGKLGAATSVDGWLISHAGMHSSFFGAMPDDADVEVIADALNRVLKQKLTERKEVPMIDWIGWLRGGRNPHGGIFWADFEELAKDKRNLIQQIVGHSPQADVRKVGERLWCVDVGAALSGRVPALVKRGVAAEWEPVVVRTPNK